MDTPAWVSYVQAGAIVVWFGFMVVGWRRGQAGRLPSGARIIDPAKIDFRLIWIGLVIWAASSLFAFVAAFVWFGVFRVVLTSITLVLTAFLFWMAWRLMRRREAVLVDDMDDDEDDD